MTSNGKRPETGREYLRVSKLHQSGETRSTHEQHAENLADAEREGVVLGAPYVDDARSASRYARRERDGFNQLMDELRAGEFGADALWLWESSRGSRRVGEWVELIELCERSGIVIRVSTHGRFYDPRNARDRRTLLEDAVDSEYESSKTATRCQRTSASMARAGKPTGQVPYGFQRRYHERTRALLAQEAHPDEAPVVRRLFERFLAGHSLRSIARELERDGITNRSGRPFSAQHLRTMLLNPAYAGLRVHAAGVKQGYRGVALGEATLTPGVWDGLVTEEQFWQARQKVTDPSRVTRRPGRAKHLSSMIGMCGECGSSPLVAIYKSGGRRYRCRDNACVLIDADVVDEVAVTEMQAYLSRADTFEMLRQHSEQDNAERVEVRGQVESLRARLDELADAVASGQVSVSLAARTEPQLLAQLKAAEQREQELATPAVLRGFVDPQVSVAEQWDDIPMSARRELARALLTPSMVGTLKVYRRQAGRTRKAKQTSARERVRFDPTDHPAAA